MKFFSVVASRGNAPIAAMADAPLVCLFVDHGLLRCVDAIVIAELRRYDYVVALPAVETIDFMTDHWAQPARIARQRGRDRPVLFGPDVTSLYAAREPAGRRAAQL